MLMLKQLQSIKSQKTKTEAVGPIDIHGNEMCQCYFKSMLQKYLLPTISGLPFADLITHCYHFLMPLMLLSPVEPLRMLNFVTSSCETNIFRLLVSRSNDAIETGVPFPVVNVSIILFCLV